MKPKPLHFFAPCPRGLESILADELEQLEAAYVKPSNGGVHFQGDWETCYRTNLESRIASRILWQVADQAYINEDQIYKTSYALPWNDWFSPAHTIRVNLAAIMSITQFGFCYIKNQRCGLR